MSETSTSSKRRWQYKSNAEMPAGEQLPPGVRRIALGVEYDGSRYCGWQRQKHSPSVQEALETALSSVANEPIRLICAGRTDTGVHGSEQVVHFDTRAQRTERNWMMGVNTAIDNAIALTWATEVSASFHARFSASSRTYRYLIANTRYRPALLNRGMTWVRDPLDEGRMDRALIKLQGTHDFSSYRGAGCQANTASRCVQSTRVFRQNNLLIVEICANAFLLHMVRNLVGQLIEVGRGRVDEDEMKRVLDLKDRTKAAVTAPPHGLYLVKVSYPSDFNLPSSQQNHLGPEFLAEV